MDAMNIALLGGGMMPGLGGNPVMPDVHADAESFGAVLGGMMTQAPVQTADAEIPAANEFVRGMSLAGAMENRTAADTGALVSSGDAKESLIGGMDIASAIDRDFTFSAASENAMMNLIGSYFRAGTESTDGTDSGTVDTDTLMAKWQEILSNLGSGEISQLSAFSSELETALFSGSRYGLDSLDSDDIKWTAGDVFIEVLGNRTKKKNSSDSDIGMMLAQTIASTGYTGFNVTDLMNIGESGDLMGTYSDRTVQNITSSMMKSVFGDTGTISSDNAQLAALRAALGTASGQFDAGITANDITETVDSRNIPVLNDLPAVQGNAANVNENAKETVSAPSFEEAVRLVRNSTDEQVEGFSKLLSDTVREYIEENGIDINVETAPVTRTQENTAPERNDQPVQDIPAEAYTSRRITRADAPAPEKDIPRIRLDAQAKPENIAVEPGRETAAEQSERVSPERALPQMQDIPRQAERTEVYEADNGEEISHSVNVQTAEAVLDRIMSDPSDGDREIVIRLDPRSLGEITVKVTKAENGDVSVTLAAHNPETARLLSEHSSELVQMLSDRTAAHTDVNVVDPAQAGQYMSFDTGSPNGFRFGQERPQNSRRISGDPRFADADDEEIRAVSGADGQEYISEEARLWTTA